MNSTFSKDEGMVAQMSEVVSKGFLVEVLRMILKRKRTPR